jgi:biopolymer transport protein ExbD
MLLDYYEKSKRNRPIKLELAPLIDVIFILLIFFAVSTSFVANKMGMKLKLPAASSTTDQKKGILLSINKNQELFLDEKPLLIEELKDRISAIVSQTPDTQIILNADVTTPYDIIITLLDQVRLGGCFDLVLEAEKKETHVNQ